MSRLFYHIAQDNLGNLLFGVSGTMRLAGTGTAATIYGDAALSVPIPNPMTNHASFGSFKCYLGPGTYDFYMAKAGYTFETLTGVQGGGTMANQDANAVTITGGIGTFTGGLVVPDGAPGAFAAVNTHVAAGTNRYNYYSDGTAPNYFAAMVEMGQAQVNTGNMVLRHNKSSMHGLIIEPSVTDAAGLFEVLFKNIAGAVVGTITTTGAATAYNTTSDARLKHAITPLTGALAVVQALRPVRFRWNADESVGHGFLAHEVAEVVDGVITGEADAVDNEGNIQPQQIDMSKLVPWLAAGMQELRSQVEVLQAQVLALQARLA